MVSQWWYRVAVAPRQAVAALFVFGTIKNPDEKMPVRPIEISPDEKVPLWVDRETGTVRIVGSRLKLQSVIAVLYEGYTRAADIVSIYDTLSCDQAQQIIDWYHTRREEVDAYMEWSEQQAIAVMDKVAPYVDGNTRSRKGLPW